ncbi:MAG: erythromycin esterase family protein [Methanothrix sp.]
MTHATLSDWIRTESIPFSLDSPQALDSSIDLVMASLSPRVELLGFGEALHGGEEILMLRNRLFQRLVERHGYSAFAIESSFPRARTVNDYVTGRGPKFYDEIRESGFGHGFGRLEANRELVEWMRVYNADPAHGAKLHLYGFDIPGLEGGLASPSQTLHFVLDLISSIDSARGLELRGKIDSLIGNDFDWENTEALADPAKAIGLSPSATALRIAAEDLMTELRTRRPELVAKSSRDGYLEALHYTTVARDLLSFHAGVAVGAGYARLLAIRDAAMADNLAYILGRERTRGRVLAFAHNSHLQRGMAVLPWARWWPAGSHLHDMLGARYAVIGSALGASEENGIGQPEPGTLEAMLTAAPGNGRFIPTHRGQGLPASEIASLSVRQGSTKNPTYVALTPQSLKDFDFLAVLDRATYSRGGPPLGQRDSGKR